jgi:hypothetical protein
MDKTSKLNRAIEYFLIRGQIFLSLEKYEQAYLSFAKCLSIPNLSQEQDINP